LALLKIMDTTNETNGANGTNGADKPGLVDIAKGAMPPEVPAKRGRGRPAGSGKAAASAGVPAPVPAPEPVFIWNEKNAGALTRPFFSVPAFVLGIKEIALTPEEEAVLMPAMVPLYQEFFPYMSPKLAAAIGGLATLGPIVAAKTKIYLDATKEARLKAAHEKARKEGNYPPTEEPRK